MTGNELRQNVADIMTSWVGIQEGSDGHRQIIGIFNAGNNGYDMKMSDHWCAAAVSAALIKGGVSDYTGSECSCDRFINIAKNNGSWVEDDSYMPKVGDLVLYDRQDSGCGDNQGGSDHIGLVTSVDPATGTYVSTEGNSSNMVKTHVRTVNQQDIRGFIAPDYDAIAVALYGPGANGPDLMSDTASETVMKPALPERPVTRGQMLNLVYDLSGQPELENRPSFFKDTEWTEYEASSAWARENGIAEGTGDNLYRPEDPIQREDMICMLYRTAQMRGLAGPETQGSLDRFSDADQVDAYAKEAMQWAVGTGLISGTSVGTLNPKGIASLEEVQVVQDRCAELMPDLFPQDAPGLLDGISDASQFAEENIGAGAVNTPAGPVPQTATVSYGDGEISFC